MNVADGVLVLRQFGIEARCVHDDWWSIVIPWATGTPLEVDGEIVGGHLVCDLADALLRVYATPPRRAAVRDELSEMIKALVADDEAAVHIHG